MKVAVLIDKFPAPSETFILGQITGLIDRGHEVDIYANTKEDEFAPYEEGGKYDFASRAWYLQQGKRRIPANGLLRLAKAFNLLHLAWKRGRIDLIKSLNVARFGKKAASLELLYRSMAFAKKSSYDIVHAHFGQNGQVAAALRDIGAIHGKIITTYYGHDISHYIKQNGHDVYRFLFAHGDLFIAISESMRDELIRLGCNRDKIVIHKLGIDLARFQLCPRRHRTDATKIRLLTVGRLVEKKGLEYGVRAVAKVVKKLPQVEYEIAGDGVLREDLTRLIGQLNMTQHIRLLGWQAPEKIAKLMEDADIFLAPSVTSKNGDQEGTPTVLIEALARGLPVISTLHSGIPEVVQNGQSGLLVPERDIDALATQLEYLCTHRDRWEDMGRAGRTWVERHHDIVLLNDQLVTCFERLLDGQTPLDPLEDAFSTDHPKVNTR